MKGPRLVGGLVSVAVGFMGGYLYNAKCGKIKTAGNPGNHPVVEYPDKELKRFEDDIEKTVSKMKDRYKSKMDDDEA